MKTDEIVLVLTILWSKWSEPSLSPTPGLGVILHLVSTLQPGPTALSWPSTSCFHQSWQHCRPTLQAVFINIVISLKHSSFLFHCISQNNDDHICNNDEMLSLLIVILFYAQSLPLLFAVHLTHHGKLETFTWTHPVFRAPIFIMGAAAGL